MYDGRFAEIYDAAHGFKNYAGEAAYVRDAIRRLNPGARTMLEVACGTGRFIEHFQRDFEVQGLDASRAMLARAAGLVPGVVLHEGDMTAFELQTQFDVVCCLFRSIANVATRERFHRAVACLAKHVRPGGLLVLEPYFTPEAFWDGHVGFNKYDSAELKVAWMHVQRRLGVDRSSLEHHFMVGRAGSVEYFSESHELALLAREDYESAFRECGLALHYDPMGPTGVGLYLGVAATS